MKHCACNRAIVSLYKNYASHCVCCQGTYLKEKSITTVKFQYCHHYCQGYLSLCFHYIYSYEIIKWNREKGTEAI